LGKIAGDQMLDRSRSADCLEFVEVDGAGALYLKGSSHVVDWRIMGASSTQSWMEEMSSCS
jgi:hypothetical protein